MVILRHDSVSIYRLEEIFSPYNDILKLCNSYEESEDVFLNLTQTFSKILIFHMIIDIFLF